MRKFNTTGLCVPEDDYMVDITERLDTMKKMVDEGQYFTINRGRQYGKTTTLYMFQKYLQDEYCVLSLDFQAISNASFQSEESYVQAFSRILLRKRGEISFPENIIEQLRDFVDRKENKAVLDELMFALSDWCMDSDKPIVMFIDEVDSATNNQVFLDFLAQLRLQYLERKRNKNYKTFQSVILAGVTDVKNLKRKLRPDEAAKVNSPWNIAVDFTLDMSLSADGIAGMLSDYEEDHHTGMDVNNVAQEIRDYTGGYPFLVCRICQILDSELAGTERFTDVADTWTSEGINEAVRILVSEGNTLFDSLMGKVINNAEMSDALENLLFSGENIAYNRYNLAIGDAILYGFIRVDGNMIKVANRIFEMLLYNYYLSESEMKNSSIYRAGSNDRELFIRNGHLDMDKVLERFVVSFDDLYGDVDESFNEEEGRRRFLLYIRPIINGTGNYYVEARTRNNKRMDVVIDYLGERFVVELKIWRGNAYNERGEEQLSDYLDYFHLQKGYMLSYNFNQSKEVGVKTIAVGDKVLVEACV
ncbi:MAG: AAA-like domain-containing protein [Lachnospiraceae bacterium]|nr:AAA-like domain-containing protein [Lachnospiraceae bacterium]